MKQVELRAITLLQLQPPRLVPSSSILLLITYLYTFVLNNPLILVTTMDKQDGTLQICQEASGLYPTQWVTPPPPRSKPTERANSMDPTRDNLSHNFNNLQACKSCDYKANPCIVFKNFIWVFLSVKFVQGFFMQCYQTVLKY